MEQQVGRRPESPSSRRSEHCYSSEWQDGLHYSPSFPLSSSPNGPSSYGLWQS
jgi:hypothetical protein